MNLNIFAPLKWLGPKILNFRCRFRNSQKRDQYFKKSMLENLEVCFELLWNAWSSTMVNREKRENDFTFTYALIYRGTVLI